MSFMAGIISVGNILKEMERRQFLNAFSAIKIKLPWPSEMLECQRAVLVRAGFVHMWQGPKILSSKRYDVVSSGVQWKKIPGKINTLDYLLKELTSEVPNIENYFDYFNCVIVDKNSNYTVLANDHPGMSPLIYMLDGETLLFSSHQTFLKKLLKHNFEVDWQAVLEFLIIGHYMGIKSLLRGGYVLPAGCKLILKDQKLRVIPYTGVQTVREEDMTLEESATLISDHMLKKCESYSTLADRKVAGFLSGGWDSRYIISTFANAGNMAMTYTTQQRTRVQNYYISEKAIARELARHIRLKNRFIIPVYRTMENLPDRACILDYTTWFHDWAFSLTECLPYDEYIFPDGIAGDILLRGLYISPLLIDSLKSGDRDAAIKYFHAKYLKGFNTYTKGVEAWKTAILPDVLNGFAGQLMEDISREIHEIENADFVTTFLLRNRTRRGISPLPLFIFETRGEVFFPFCDSDFIRKAISIPLKFRVDESLYISLLERSGPGLSEIPSTNMRDISRLRPFLMDSLKELSWQGQLIKRAGGFFPAFQRMFNERAARISREKENNRVNKIMDAPPGLFMDILSPKLKKAIKGGDAVVVKKSRLFLEKMMMIDHFYNS